MVAFVLAAAGYAYYRVEEAKIIDAQYQTLDAVDELKASQIKKWRDDRIAEAGRVAARPPLPEITARALAAPGDQNPRDQLEAILAQETAGRDHVTARLIGFDEAVLAGDPNPLAPSTRQAVEKVLATGKPTFSEFYRGEDGVIYVELAVPVLAPGGRVLAALVARQDAEVSLFPLIQFWPVPSSSAETYLVKRDGDEVVFLTNLRFRSGSALSYRLPLTETGISSVQAVLGREGIFRGRDYRGVEVVSDLERVPESGWFILSEVDEKEILTGVRSQAAGVFLITLLSILLTAALIALFYRRRQAGILREMVETERQKTEALRNVQEMEEQKRDILRTAIDGFCLMDTTGRIREVNEAYCRLTGYRAEELPAMNISDLDAAESREEIAEHIRRILAAGNDRFETKLRRKDGGTIDVEVSVQARRSENLLVAFLRDITARKKLEAELKEAMEAARTASQAKSDFLAVVSHELRTPLHAVLGFADLLMDTDLGQEQRGFLQTIRDSGGHLLRVVNDILDFSSIEKGVMRLNHEAFSLPALVRACGEAGRQAAEARGLEFRWEIAPDVPEFAVGDERRIRQILLNLVGNAVKFTAQGSVVLRVSRVAGERRPRLEFAVRDTGQGIPADMIGRLFQPFTQGDSSLGRSFEGTGLGLAISRRLADAMEGTIAVDSEPGRGSTFSLRIPLETTGGFEPADGVSPAAEPRRGTGGRVLVVEDDRVNRILATRILRTIGFQADSVADGQAAIDAYAPGKYFAILMDVQMPVVDGLDATARIRQLEAASGTRVAIIALTANVMPEDRHKCLSAGMDDFVTKPFRKEQIAEVLARNVR